VKLLTLLAICIVFTSTSITAKEKSKLEASTIKGSLKAADGKPPYGVFDVISSDGQVYREVIRADGSFSSTAKDGSTVNGVWEQRKDGIFCSKPIKAPKFRCKYEEVNTDGVWTSTELEGGNVSIVLRLKN